MKITERFSICYSGATEKWSVHDNLNDYFVLFSGTKFDAELFKALLITQLTDKKLQISFVDPVTCVKIENPQHTINNLEELAKSINLVFGSTEQVDFNTISNYINSIIKTRDIYKKASDERDLLLDAGKYNYYLQEVYDPRSGYIHWCLKNEKGFVFTGFTKEECLAVYQNKKKHGEIR